MYGFRAEQSHSEERMPRGLFTLKQQLQGVIQKAWNTGLGVLPLSSYLGSFNGSSQYLSVASTTALGLGTGNFTIECWVNPSIVSATSSDYTFVFDMRNGSNDAPCLTIQESVFRFQTDLVASVALSPTISPWTWYHIAYVRNGSYLYCYVNGNLANVGGTATTLNNGSSCPITIGARYASAFRYFPGAISNFRVVKGTAVYTSNFTPPTSPLTSITNTALLTLQSATIVDNSGNSLSITNTGSVTTSAGVANVPFTAPVNPTPAVDYLVVAGGGSGGGAAGGAGSSAGGGAGGLLQGSVPVTAGSSITVTVGAGGTGPATTYPSPSGVSGNNSVLGSISATGGGAGGTDNYGNARSGAVGGSGGGGGWGNNTFTTGSQGIVGQGNSGGAYTATTGSPYGAAGGGGAGTIGLSTSGAYPGNGGAGIASAISGTVTAYAGGGGGGGSSGYYGAGGAGGGGAGGDAAGGTSGTVNTGGGGGGVGNTGGGATPGSGGSGIVIVSYPDIYAGAASTTGSPTVSTSGSGSIFFNGSSYFNYNAQTPFAFGSGDFTIEFWIYYTSTPDVIFDWRQTGGGVSPVPTIYYNSGALRYFVGTDQIVGGSLFASTWYHVAICKISNVTKMYINGTQSGSNYSDTNTYLVGSGRPVIAANGSSPGSAGSYYLSNIRFVKGVGVYTGAFASYVPTSPLTATQPAGPSGSNIAAITSTATSLLLNSNSGSFLADSSTNSYAATSVTGTPAWNQASPFATGLGYKNRVYTYTGSGTITF